jgi:hypothetical protein
MIHLNLLNEFSPEMTTSDIVSDYGADLLGVDLDAGVTEYVAEILDDDDLHDLSLFLREDRLEHVDLLTIWYSRVQVLAAAELYGSILAQDDAKWQPAVAEVAPLPVGTEVFFVRSWRAADGRTLTIRGQVLNDQAAGRPTVGMVFSLRFRGRATPFEKLGGLSATEVACHTVSANNCIQDLAGVDTAPSNPTQEFLVLRKKGLDPLIATLFALDVVPREGVEYAENHGSFRAVSVACDLPVEEAHGRYVVLVDRVSDHLGTTHDRGNTQVAASADCLYGRQTWRSEGATLTIKTVPIDGDGDEGEMAQLVIDYLGRPLN